MKRVQWVIAVTSRDLEEDFDRCFHKNGLTAVVSSLGHGTVTPGMLDLLGLASDEKAVLFAVGDRASAERTLDALIERHGLHLPGRGIAFTIPVTSICKALSTLCEGTIKEEEDVMDMPYELIVAIANKGTSELVMDAARAAGAPGGTILHAKGTGAEGTQKFFGMSLAEEQEMMFIVVPKAQKPAVMQSIAREAGATSPAKTLLFSLPVSAAAGLHSADEDEDA